MPDLPQIVSVDDGFLGVISRIDPAQVPPQYVSEAINRRFEDQAIKNRWGITQQKWGGKWTLGSRVVTVTSNQDTATPVSGALIPNNTVVACDQYVNELVFPSGTRVWLDNSAITRFTAAAYTFTGAPKQRTLTYYASTTPFTDILGTLAYRDPDTGFQALIVATNEVRDDSDYGQGKVYLVRPNSGHLEIPLNGHDIYAPVRLIQSANGIVMLRPGNARYYFSGGASALDSLVLEDGSGDITLEDGVSLGTEDIYKIELNVTPDLQTGDRVTIGQIGSAPNLWTGSTTSGQGFGVYVNVVGNFVSLHLDYANSLNGTNPIQLNGLANTSDRYYIELSNNTTGYDVTQGIDDSYNDGMPIIMQASYDTTTSNPVSALDAGFDRIPSVNSILTASPTQDTITVPNHNFVPGDQVTISNASGGGVSNAIYYVYPTSSNTLKLFSGTTEETDSLNTAERAVISFTSVAGVITAYTILNQGAGYLSAPTVDVDTPGGGTTASITLSITDGKVTGVTINNGGTGYSASFDGVVTMPSTLVDITATLTGTIKKSNASGASVPAGRDGLYFQNRLLLLYGNDYLAVSDVLDPLHYSPVLNEFKLNTGSNDRVVALYPFNATTLLVFKERSVLAVENLYGDLSTTRLTEITREFGCVSQASIAGTGSDVIFLSQRGVISLKQTEFGISQSVVLPLSDPIQDVIDEVDQAHWDKASAAYFSNRYILSVPVEGGDGTNTRTLVFNFLNKAWEGFWEGDLLVPRYYSTLIVAGTDTLCWADESGLIHSFDPLSLQDRTVTGVIQAIETSVTFRGHTGEQDIDHKQWTDLQFEFFSWSPRYSISTLFDGVSEEYTVSTNETKSRTQYYLYGQGTYNTNNSTNTFLSPYREDYSTLPGLRCGTSGWKAGLFQSFTQKARLRRHSISIQPKVTTDQGALNIYSMKTIGVPFRLYGKNDV